MADLKIGLKGNTLFATCGIASYFALVAIVRLSLGRAFESGLSHAFSLSLEPLLAVSFAFWSIALGMEKGLRGTRATVASALVGSVILSVSIAFDVPVALHLVGFIVFVVSIPRLFLESCRALVALQAPQMALAALLGIVGFRVFRAVFDILPSAVSFPVSVLALATLLSASALKGSIVPDIPVKTESESRGSAPWLMAGLVLMGGVFGAVKGVSSFPQNPLPVTLNEVGLVLSVILLAVYLIPKKTNGLVVAYRATALLALGGICTFAMSHGAMSSISHAMVLASQQLLLTLVWIVAPTFSFRANGVSCRPFGWCFVLFYFSSGVSLFAWQVSPIEGASAWLPAAVTFASLLFFLFMFKESDLQSHLVQHETKLKSEKEYLEEACEAIAGRYSLSSREAEILPLWVDGKQASEIAETLFVSENTVRSHIHHIYTKTGTHGRKELQKLLGES